MERRGALKWLGGSLFGWTIASRLAAGERGETDPQARPLVGLQIATRGDLLEYSTRQLSCPAGSRVRVSFSNAARYVDFEHNWVLLRPGTFDAVVAAAVEAGAANGWLPAGHPGIIAATPQARRGQTVVAEFDAPPEAAARLEKAQAAAQGVADISGTHDEAKITAAVTAVDTALEALERLFPAGLRPERGKLPHHPGMHPPGQAGGDGPPADIR